MPQSESVAPEHPASLSCRRQIASISPSSTLFPPHKKAAGRGGGFSTEGISSIKGISQEHFVASVKLLALPEKNIQGARSHQTHLVHGAPPGDG